MVSIKEIKLLYPLSHIIFTMWSVLLVQLSLCAMYLSTSANVHYVEICPEFKTMAGFDLVRWAEGVWYQLYNDAEDTVFTNEPLRCIERRHHFDEEAQVVLVESYKLAATDKPHWSDKVIHVTDIPGLFYAYTFNHSKHYDRGELRVIDTDYDTYSVAVVCAINDKINKEYFTAGIDSRTRVMPHGKVRDVVDSFRQVNKVDITYAPVCHKDCRARC